jgi:indolepyruvate ferredoxin oxidoreductase beta subunit
MQAFNFLVAGVGGQGALLASNVLAEVGVRAGFDVKKAEVHGMSQRGGSVNSHVRWGAAVRSPVIERGQVDYLLALEELESLRYLAMLRPGGTALVGEFRIPPLSASSGEDHYPTMAEITAAFEGAGASYRIIPTLSLARDLGSTRAHNVVLLGALSTYLPGVPQETWLEVIEAQVPPKTIALNRKAFAAGRGAVVRS